MIAAQRRALILEQVRRLGGASIGDLSDSIGVSLSTIRRDLDYLTREGYLVRSHGGALLAEAQRSTFEPLREIGVHLARGAKVAIGRRAADLVENGQSVIFDSSSTVLEAARAVVARRLRLTACTNDIAIAAVLSAGESIQVIVLGGSVRAGSLTLVGDPGQSFLDRLHADVAFIGIHSLALGRLTETSLEVAAMKRRMIECAAQVVVLADSSKFAHPAFCDVCPLERADIVVTDDGLAPEPRGALGELDVETVIAAVGGD
ncbi:MAG TPA: DeoR/GlpR family DNA-binding transcription regulator [Geminicoccaceae bacterium]|nr:DeoR/GlpR family DNA-binding transcription regulator [Geminicoccaceae bacterium]